MCITLFKIQQIFLPNNIDALPVVEDDARERGDKPEG
jgi:hypothetical protein